MDPWDFAEPVDVLSKLPKNFHELIESKKWQERKEGLEILLQLVTDNIRLDPSVHYNEIVKTLSRILAKDANINVAAIAAKCVTQLAKGLRKTFAPYAAALTPVIFEKFKEKKSTLRDPLIEAIDAIITTTSLEAICDDVAAALGKPNPQIKSQVNFFLYRIFKTYNEVTAPKKVVKTLTPLVGKCACEADVEVREAAFSALGAISKAIGIKNAMMMVSDIANDKAKVCQVEKYCNQAIEESQVEAAQKINAEGNGEDVVNGEEVALLRATNLKLSDEVTNLKIKLDKSLGVNKKTSTELQQALQKINKMETELKQYQTSKATLQTSLAAATKKIETLERQLKARPASNGTATPLKPRPTGNGAATPRLNTAPAPAPMASLSRRSVVPTGIPSVASSSLSRRSIVPTGIPSVASSSAHTTASSNYSKTRPTSSLATGLSKIQKPEHVYVNGKAV